MDELLCTCDINVVSYVSFSTTKVGNNPIGILYTD